MIRKPTVEQMFLAPILATFLLAGCVTEEVPRESPGGPPLFSFPVTNPSRLMEAGSYHGTNLFFEIDLKRDLSPDWVSTHEELQLQLQFITPKIDRNREIYEVGKLHRVVLSNSRWEVGQQRYALRDRSRLYVFKRVEGDFEFSFRGQPVVVESPRPWIPSVYYYFEETALGSDGPATDSRPGTVIQRREVTREVVQVGAGTIELFPRRRQWQVNGGPWEFDPETPLVLRGAVGFAPAD